MKKPTHKPIPLRARKSNVKSSEYRAGGGRAWHKYKAKATISFQLDEKKRTRYENFERQKGLDKSDKYTVKKAGYKQGVKDAEAGLPRQSQCSEYLAGYSYGEWIRKAA